MWNFKFPVPRCCCSIVFIIILFNSTTVSAKNCGSNPSTIVLKRGEKITIEYWNPPVSLDEAPEAPEQHDEPEAHVVASESPVVFQEQAAITSQSPIVAESLVTSPAPEGLNRDGAGDDDVTTQQQPIEQTTQVVDREPQGDAESPIKQWTAAAAGVAGVDLTGQDVIPEFLSITTVEPESNDGRVQHDEGSGFPWHVKQAEQLLVIPRDGNLESSGDGGLDEMAQSVSTDEPSFVKELETELVPAPTEMTTEATETTEMPSRSSSSVQVLTNLIIDDDTLASRPSVDDDTMEFVIKSESLHPVKAPTKPSPPPPSKEENKMATVVLRDRPTTEAVPIDSTEQTPAAVDAIESKFTVEQLLHEQEGSGSGDAPIELRTNANDVLLAIKPLVHVREEEEGSGGSFDGQITHTFDHETFTKDLPAPVDAMEAATTESQTEQTSSTEHVMLVDDGPAEFRNDDILISRIRTIVNSLTNAKPLFRRTTGLFQSVFSRRNKRSPIDKEFYRTAEFKQFLRSQPLPVRRALSPNFAGRFSRNMEDQTVLVDEECDLNIKTEPGLHLLMTFHNLSAPYTVDCAGAYVEIEREGNGFEARWCGNPIGQQRGMRSHVIFARSEVRVSVFNSPEIVRQKLMADDAGKTTRGLSEPLPPTGFTADIEVIDLHDAGQYTAFQRSQAYSTVNRLIG